MSWYALNPPHDNFPLSRPGGPAVVPLSRKGKNIRNSTLASEAGGPAVVPLSRPRCPGPVAPPLSRCPGPVAPPLSRPTYDQKKTRLEQKQLKQKQLEQKTTLFGVLSPVSYNINIDIEY